MSVIAAVITRHCVAISSDSLITYIREDGKFIPCEWEKSKIIPVTKFHAAMAYWGLASYGQWSTYEWLRDRAQTASNFATLEEFANSLRDSLESELSKLTLKNSVHKGIGIHLTGYEYINGYWIPELFLCSNFADTTYSNLCCLHLTRESYHTISNESPKEEHKEESYRLTVHTKLHEGIMLQYNNGDPYMFNPAAKSLFQLIEVIRRRKILKDPDNIETYRSIVRRPIEIISAVQRDFCRENTRIVGGRIHDLVITPNGQYSSTSGDEP